MKALLPTPQLGKSLEVLGEKIEEINKRNGWDLAEEKDFSSGDKVPRLLCLIHSEVSEALEAFRVSDKENFIEEIADVFIRLIDLMQGLRLLKDLSPAIMTKLAKNASRGYRHGDKII